VVLSEIAEVDLVTGPLYAYRQGVGHARSGDAAVTGTAAPIAAAIGVLGVVYGALAQPILGGGLTIASSVVTFSGAAQFTTVGLLGAGASAAGVLAAVVPLALRHLPLGALVRTRLPPSPRRRALLSMLLTDETVGLAVADRGSCERIFTIAGGLAYGAWVVGTVAGTLGASAASFQPVAEALFPVLFVALAMMTAARRSDAARAVVSGMCVVTLLTVVPAVGVLGAVGVAVACAAVGRT
jgi:predicted branched-subunit amino acid permease